MTDDEVLAGWDAYWKVWAFQRASDPIDREALEEVATPQVVDAAIEFFEREREGGFQPSVPRVYPAGTVTSIDEGSATIEACTLITRSPSGIPGTVYDVVMEQTDAGGWIVGELAVVSAAGCAPAELASQAIAAYEAYWDDRDALSKPADPEAPWLEARTTDQHLEVLVELYTDWQATGVYFKGRPETHPEVVEVGRDWAMIILDCQLMDGSGWGLYDVETDERTGDEAPIGEGERDLRSATVKNDMADASGDWRVATLAGEVNASCEFAPTEDALPQY